MVSPDKIQGPNIPLLVGQGALQNLSLDEVIQNPSSSSSSSSPPLFRGNITFHGKLSKKTVDEVWEHVNAAYGHDPSVQSQPTLGETTLEDFLVRRENQNGFVTPQPVLEINPIVVVKQVPELLWLQMHDTLHQAVLESNFQVSQFCFKNPVMENNGYSDNQLALPILPVQAAAATTDSATSEVGVERKRQFHDGTMEKTIEKRQRRMIKNRESAARSRARKQAYTNQLEHEVCQLGRINNWLKKLKHNLKKAHLSSSSKICETILAANRQHRHKAPAIEVRDLGRVDYSSLSTRRNLEKKPSFRINRARSQMSENVEELPSQGCIRAHRETRVMKCGSTNVVDNKVQKLHHVSASQSLKIKH
ncbi:hypothetical protein RJ639_042022 [Escallonia herrerae]|uniref:BZIP domain-containing protein n=1 Tax=Escallonia herrerae TaxID=1293975 RepID=A0AA89B5N6_9ASTE|nr:hypothetical protein RJ639_042022 [Escallonia herrerae]